MSKKIEENVNEEVRPRTWLLVVLIIIAIVISIVLLNKVVTDRKNAKENEPSIFNLFRNTENEINKSSFNSDFEMHMGTKYGSNVSRLLDEVITNNKKNKNQLIEVVYKDTKTSDPTEIKNLKKNFGTWDKVEVSIDYDDNGYVNLITLEDIDAEENNNNNDENTTSSQTNTNTNTNANSSVPNTTSEFTKQAFNTQATFHSGNKSGFFVKSMIDYVISSNSANSEHILSVEYNGIKTSDSASLSSLKSKFSDFTDYNVTVTYASDGFANGFVVE